MLCVSSPSTRRSVAVCVLSFEDEKRTRYAIAATTSPSVSILSSYTASGAKGSVVVGPGGFTPTEDRLASATRLGEGIQISEVQPGVPMGKPIVGSGVMV
jgi:hypothetical protein